MVFILAALSALALDQATKYLIVHGLRPDQAFSVLGVLDIHYIHNSGAAFGMLPSGGRLFIAVALLVLSLLAVSFRRILSADRWTALALGLIAGGTTGNLLDRLRFGYVVDFIDLRWWPVFNVADSCICIGVGLLIYKLLRQERA